jgi:hypothetical protein
MLQELNLPLDELKEKYVEPIIKKFRKKEKEDV